MKMLHLRLMMLLLPGLLASCSLVAEISYRIPIKLRVEDYTPFVVTERKSTETTLQIHGFLFSSGHSTSAVKTHLNGKCLQVDLWADGATHVKRNRLSDLGDLAIAFAVPDSVEEVRVGRDSVLVWDRKGGSRFPASRLKQPKPEGKAKPLRLIAEKNRLELCRWIDRMLMSPTDKISVPGKIRY